MHLINKFKEQQPRFYLNFSVIFQISRHDVLNSQKKKKKKNTKNDGKYTTDTCPMF